MILFSAYNAPLVILPKLDGAVQRWWEEESVAVGPEELRREALVGLRNGTLMCGTSAVGAAYAVLSFFYPGSDEPALGSEYWGVPVMDGTAALL